MAPVDKAASFGELLAKAKGIREADVAAEAEQEKKLVKTKKERIEKPKKVKEVKVKKELGVRKAKGKAKAKAKAKVKKEGKDGKEKKVPMVKKVRAALKRRREDQSGGDWAKSFYKHQSGFIDDVVDGQWTVCWGALGTGLVGVSLKGEEDVQKGVLQSEDLLVLFRNAPACSAQQRGKKTLAGYGGGMLDVDEQTLEWSSQRCDTNNRIIEQVIDHVSGSGKTLVAVRPPADKKYLLLGQVSKVDNVKMARCLCEKGAELIYEEKAGKFHVAMGPNCIRDSQYWGGPVLKLTRSYPQPPKISKKEKAEQSKGGALEPAGSASKRESKRLEEDESESRLSRILCKHCCFRTPSAVFHFEDLEPLGVAAYSKRFGERVKKEEKEVKEEVKVKEEPDETLRPKRRLTSKMPLPVEDEPPLDPEPTEPPATEPEASWPSFVRVEPTDM